MSLRTIVEKVGGELYDGGRRANIPAPGHSLADRSVSLLLEDGRVVVHTFGGGDWREVLDDLRERRLIDAHNAPTSISGAAQRAADQGPPSDPRRVEAARRFWDAGRGIVGTLSERHCRLRHIRRGLPGPQALRHCTETPVSAYVETKHRRPALLAAISDREGTLTGVEITYLAASGRRAQDLRLPRKCVGLVPPSSAVRLDEAAGEMCVGEGLFTTLSASERFSLPAWALMSIRNLKTWVPPQVVRSVLIAADRGAPGVAAAEVLAARLDERGVRTRIEYPPEPHGDFNEAACLNTKAQQAEVRCV